MKKVLKVVAFVFIGLVILGGIGAYLEENEGAASENEVTAAKASKIDADSLKDAKEAAKIAERTALKKELESKVAKLKPNFTVTKDEMSGLSFYKHKVFGKYWPNYKTLTCEMNDKGFIYLRSNYYSSDWLFHSKVTVKIGEDGGPMYTEEVPTFNKNNRTDHNGGEIWENVTYSQGSHIIESVAKADPSHKVLIRFHGSKYHDDATMGPKTKVAFKESYELSQAITKLNEL